MTKAQVDLMLHDRPVVDYKSGKSKGKDSKPSRKAIDEANERGRQNYERRKGGKVGKLTLGDFEPSNNINTEPNG